jgi:hypothetical protein
MDSWPAASLCAHQLHCHRHRLCAHQQSSQGVTNVITHNIDRLSSNGGYLLFGLHRALQRWVTSRSPAQLPRSVVWANLARRFFRAAAIPTHAKFRTVFDSSLLTMKSMTALFAPTRSVGSMQAQRTCSFWRFSGTGTTWTAGALPWQAKKKNNNNENLPHSMSELLLVQAA